MPKGVKPPKTFCGKKGRSGTKTKGEFVEQIKEKIKQEALIELANKVVYKQLVRAEETESAISAKEFAMPITLKGMGDKIIGDKDNPLVIKQDIDEKDIEKIIKSYAAKRKDSGS